MIYINAFNGKIIANIRAVITDSGRSSFVPYVLRETV